MSVPEPQRGKGKLEVCTKARDLADYTLQITSNEKIFLPQFQRSLTDSINGTAINIHVLVWSANNIYVNSAEDWHERKQLQEQAITQCTLLLSLIDLAHKVFHLRLKRVKYWGEKVQNVKTLIRAWKESDGKRYRSRFGV